MNKITKQCVAAVASLAMASTLCVAGAVVAGSSAWAVDNQAAEKAPWDLGNEAATKKGSITITKYKYKLIAGGKQEKKEKVAGAEFTVTKVTKLNKSDKADLDLTNYDDWMKVSAKVESLNANPNDANLVLDTEHATKVSTAAKTEGDKVEGVAKFPNLAIGLYKVEETKAASGYAVLARPFFMTIPEVTRKNTDKDNTYKYDVSVEPKNKSTKDAIQKQVDTAGTVGAGDEIPYTITTDVTTTTVTDLGKYTKDDLQGFAVWDDALISAYSDVTADLTTENAKALVKEVKIGNTTIAADKYTVSVEQNSTTNANSPENGRARIKVTFTDAGLTAIANALNAATDKTKLPKLTVKFVFKLAPAAPAGANGFYNKYGYQPGHGKGGKTPDPVNPPENDPNTKVTLVKFQIKKVNGVKESEALKGAKFAVFAKQTDAKACAADKARSADSCQNKATKGYTTGTTVADGLEGATNGTADKTGLTGAFEVKVGQKFYVVETQAPDGFALSPKVEEVTAQNSGDGYDTNTSTFVYKFKDLPNGGLDGDGHSWFNLPETGAAGVIIFALIGLGLVGSGMFVFLKNRKKEEEQAA